MNWSDPRFTLLCFVLFLVCTLKIHAEYALSGFLFVLVVLMSRTLFL